MVELEQNKKSFEERGLKVAAISYDSVEILHHFSSRNELSYPLLSDEDHRIIEAFGILNRNFPPDHRWFGIPFPGYYVIDEHGRVQSKFFEEDHRDRYTAASVLVRTFGGAGGEARGEAKTPHLKLSWQASNKTVRGGQRLTLIVNAELPPGMHVYAPEVTGGYIPIQWDIASSEAWLASPAGYPKAEMLHLPAIQETVPVYQGRFQIMRDVLIGTGDQVRPALDASGRLALEGSFRYQACDDKLCYPPATIPLRWELDFESHDRTRVPESMRRGNRDQE